MKNIISMAILSIAMMLCATTMLSAKGKAVEVASVKELAAVISKSNQAVTMKPGVYKMSDYINSSVINQAPLDGVNRKAMLLFSGDNNTFDFTDVTIEIDTKLLGAFKVSVNEIYVTGSNNYIKGLTIKDIGNNPPPGKGARSFVVSGTNCKIDGVTLHMNGSSPYGYGDLLGKGKRSVVRLNKHSGMLIEGLADTILNCSIYSKSFGHLFFIQGGRDVYFENCYAEAVIRSTDEMLAEKKGPAFDAGFVGGYGNHEGNNKILPGYAKSLSECGFRNYGSGGVDKHATGAMTFVNCRAKNARIGFALTRMQGDIMVENCDAQGCEVGYSLAGATVKSSRGDAEVGPLFNINKNEVSSVLELEVMPAVSNYNIHSLGTVAGEGHTVTLTKFEGKTRSKELPILIGSGRPAANNGYSPFGDAAASGVTLTNTSGMPVALSALSKNCTVTSSDAEVTDNGTGNKVTK
ncbi:MAG: hypothetical protein SNH35_05370 [Rikenellaceae bacterium]